MKTPYYTTDYRLEGYFVDGQPVPLPPAPTGDDRDDLLVACIDTLSHMGRGRADFWTLDALNEAIDRGHLRTISDLHTALNEQTAYFDREVTLLRRDKDPVGLEAQVRPWRDRDDLKRRLGVPEYKIVPIPVTPVLTPEQIAAREATAAVSWLASYHQRRADAVLRAIVMDEHPHDVVAIETEARRLQKQGGGRDTHELTVALVTNIEADLRKQYQKEMRTGIEKLVRLVSRSVKDLTAAILAEKTRVYDIHSQLSDDEWELFPEYENTDLNEEILKGVWKDYMSDENAKLEPSELPEPVGVRHVFETMEAAANFIYDTLTDTQEAVTRLGLDGKYAVDVEEQKGTNEEPKSN